MSDQEKTPTPDSAQPAAEPTQSAAEPQGKPHPSQHLERLLGEMRASIEKDGMAVYKRWGLALFHNYSDAEAEAQREAFGFEPKDALDFYNRGCLLASRNDFAGAAKAFAQAAKLDATLAEAQYNLALSLESAGQNAEAKKAWNQYVEQFADSEDVAEVREHLAALA
ncbi:MAG: tetratricopeptide repeat protein [Candidatus Sumerlaeia bacterium]